MSLVSLRLTEARRAARRPGRRWERTPTVCVQPFLLTLLLTNELGAHQGASQPVQPERAARLAPHQAQPGLPARDPPSPLGLNPGSPGPA